MKTLSQHNEMIDEHGMPVLRENKLKRVWDETIKKLNDEEFLRAVYDNLDTQAINTLLWKINNKYKLKLM